MSNLENPESRSAGVLLHPTALPCRTGVGSLSPSTLRPWFEFMRGARLRSWQVLPLGPTGYGDSPYQTFSVFAGNPFLLDWDPLLAAGLISPRELAPLRSLPHGRVDFNGLNSNFWPLLRKSFSRWTEAPRDFQPYGRLEAFRQENQFWLAPYCLFRALKDQFSGKPWYLWPKAFRSYDASRKSSLSAKIEHLFSFHEWTQYLFFGQWNHLRKLAAEYDIELIGDMPIFAALDSADTWSFPSYFHLKEDFSPAAFAGCPPDGFSASGQFWGNPLYDWNALAGDGYSWWMERIKVAFHCFDSVRIDHFRGLESYWEIPLSQNPAEGRWVKGPGMDFLSKVAETFPGGRLIAEDLGVLTPEVLELKADSGLPGMAVLQFAFGGGNDNFYLPHNLEKNTIIYTGTHDNNTSRGWYEEEAPEVAKDHFRRYFRVNGADASWDLIRAATASTAKLAMTPLQDYLSLPATARFNTPGTAEGNWQWRLEPPLLDRLHSEVAPYLSELHDLYRR